MTAEKVKKELGKYADLQKRQVLLRFFKTGPGEYGEGDQFLGVVVPNQRKVARLFRELELGEIQKLVKSPIHEMRLTGFFILIHQFERGDEKLRKRIFSFYKKNYAGVNNWDLVDLTAPKIFGPYMESNPKEKEILYKWVKSKNLWKRRIAVLTTFHFIRKGEFKEILDFAKELLNDQEDLIHKAVGWMLREMGKRDLATEEKFLKKYYKSMPRTMLRYAIEKFPEKKRKAFLNSKI